MTEKLTEKSCADFAALLASRAPVPGGGGAAALCGALAVSLCAMAARLSGGKNRTPEQTKRLEEITIQADSLRERLLALVEEDAEGFAPLAAAYRLPKDAVDYRETLRSATLAACRAPAGMLACCSEAAGLLTEMQTLSGRMLLSDVGCGASLCRAAMESAALNVLVNTHALPGDPEAELLNDGVRRILDADLSRLEAIALSVREVFQA